MVDWTTMTPSLLRYSPKHARKMWIYINSFVLTCSLLLLMEIFMTLEPKDRLEGTRAYLTYNIFVCFAWTVESALHFLQSRHDQKDEENKQTTQETTRPPESKNSEPKRSNEFYALVVELLFAVYFLCDAVTTIKVLWQKPSGVEAQLLDVTIDVVAYVYLLTRLIMFTEDAKINGNDEKLQDDDEATPYVGEEMT